MQNYQAEINLIDAFERIPVKIFPTLYEGSLYAAQQIAATIREKQSREEKCVLGLATGSTPKTVYTELVRLHKEEGLSFKNVIAFNLDEYFPIQLVPRRLLSRLRSLYYSLRSASEARLFLFLQPAFPREFLRCLHGPTSLPK